MYEKLLLTFSLCSLSFRSPGQNSAPPGMRYQAIARDMRGQYSRSQRHCTVKAELIVLESGEEVVYEELHHATSGEFGLLNITIGEGTNAKGRFQQCPGLNLSGSGFRSSMLMIKLFNW